MSQKNARGNERPIFFASRALSPAEQRYSATALEALAVVWACELFKPYVAGTTFEVVTDHRALVWLFGQASTTKQNIMLRWILRLQEFDFKVKYRKGVLNVVCDSMSRNPQEAEQMEPKEPIESLYNVKAATHEDLALLTSHGPIAKLHDEQKADIEVYDVGESPIFACGTCAIALGADAPRSIYLRPAFDPRHVAMHVMSRRHAHAVQKLGSQARAAEKATEKPKIGPKRAIHHRKIRGPHIKGTSRVNEDLGPRQLETQDVMLLGKIGNTTPGISMIPARKMCTFLRPLALWEDSTNEAMVLMAGSEPAVAEQKEEQAEEELDVPIQSQQPARPSPEVLGDAMVELGREQREDPALRPIIDWTMGECDLRGEERVRFSKFVEKYFMKEGVLCRATQLGEKRYRAVAVPTAKVEKILAYLHNGVAEGIWGQRSSLQK